MTTQKMTDTEAKNIFNKVIENQTDGDTIAKLEILREYFTNAEFKTNLQDFVWAINNK